MEFVGNVARKTGEPSLLAVEAAKTQAARQIGESSGLFYVPKVVRFDVEAGMLEFERLEGLATLLDLAVARDSRAGELIRRAGMALAAVHEKLVLPGEMKHDLPGDWTDGGGEDVFIHGDFACINVCFHQPSGRLVIIDWSAAPLMGRMPTFGSRYFDILWFATSVFRGAPWRRLFSWDAEGMLREFLAGYSDVSACRADKFREYAPRICRLYKRQTWLVARRRTPIKAAAYMCPRALMYIRFRRFVKGL
jgi:hypothetical protein